MPFPRTFVLSRFSPVPSHRTARSARRRCQARLLMASRRREARVAAVLDRLVVEWEPMEAGNGGSTEAEGMASRYVRPVFAFPGKTPPELMLQVGNEGPGSHAPSTNDPATPDPARRDSLRTVVRTVVRSLFKV